MSKGIAVDTILMLLVGIVVVGLIIFLVYKFLLGPHLNEQECRASLINWCNDCKLVNGWNDATAGFYPGPKVGGTDGCAKTYFGITIDETGANAKCKGHKSECNAFIPVD
jgi:hypothetical protein